jgi:hypothetical protein
LKTVVEISKELNISPQAIYKKINNQLSTKLLNHIHKDLNGKTCLDEDGERIIKESLSQKFKPEFKPVDNQFKESSQPVDNWFKENTAQNDAFITVLKAQLEVKDLQIGELLKQNDSLIKKIENMQVLLKNEQDQMLQLTNQSEQQLKISFWDKLFKKNSI